MTQKTNKEILLKGLRYMAGSLPFCFIGPVILYSVFNNQDHPWYIPVLCIGVLACIGAICLFFKGINTIMKALFND